MAETTINLSTQLKASYDLIKKGDASRAISTAMGPLRICLEKVLLQTTEIPESKLREEDIASLMRRIHIAKILDLLEAKKCRTYHYLKIPTLQSLVELSLLLRNPKVTLTSSDAVSFLSETVGISKELELVEEECGHDWELLKKATAVPNNLPDSEYVRFIGRQTEMDNIRQELERQKWPIILLDGLGGVGKTATAHCIAVGYLSSKKFDYIIWTSAKEQRYTLRGIESLYHPISNLNDLLDEISKVLELRELLELPFEEKRALIVDMLKGSDRILIVVDNFETVTDPYIEAFLMELPENVKILITTREGVGQTSLRAGLTCRIKPLNQEDTQQLVNDLIESIGLQPNPAFINEIVAGSQGYPLFTRIAVGLWKLGATIEEIKPKLERLDASNLSEFIYESAFKRLLEQAKEVLLSLQFFPGDPTLSEISAAMALPQEQVQNHLESLETMSLVERYIKIFGKGEEALAETFYKIIPQTKAYLGRKLVAHPDLQLKVQRNIDLHRTQDQSLSAEFLKLETRLRHWFGSIKSKQEQQCALFCWNALQEPSNERAKAWLGKATQTLPSYWVIDYVQGERARKAGLHHEALEYYCKARQGPALKHRILESMFESFSQLKDIENAYQTIKEILQLNPQDLHAWYDRARIEAEKGMYEVANESLDKAFNRSPQTRMEKHDSANNCYCRAKNFLRLGNRDEALRWTKRGLIFEPLHEKLMIMREDLEAGRDPFY